ncbi:MAG: nuclear transport factor 2 family protein [Cohaesibacteraceae bacterium]|nr:nuclear transport factor 2 family protein [Cohaesibacteraceae bacterium]
MSEPEEIVRKFLAAMSTRDLDTAQLCVSEDLEMIFPGNKRPTSLRAQIVNSENRYCKIEKRIDDCDVSSGDPIIVYCYGTLFGTWKNGRNFENIRFVDRFEIKNSKISRQWVWNDTGEARMASAKDIL